MTWRMACHLFVTLAVLLSVATAAQAYWFDAGTGPSFGSPVAATLLLAILAVVYAASAVHAAKRSGVPIF